MLGVSRSHWDLGYCAGSESVSLRLVRLYALRRVVVAGPVAITKKDNRLQSQNGSVLKVSSLRATKERIEEQRRKN